MTNGKPTKKKPLKLHLCFFRAPEEDWKRMLAIQERTGAAPAEQMRRGLAMWLKQQEQGR